jgi:hypothetical protein
VAQAQDPASGPAFTLVISEGHEEQVLAAAARFPDLPVRVVPTPGIVEAWLVRPDAYYAFGLVLLLAGIEAKAARPALRPGSFTGRQEYRTQTPNSIESINSHHTS